MVRLLDQSGAVRLVLEEDPRFPEQRGQARRLSQLLLDRLVPAIPDVDEALADPDGFLPFGLSLDQHDEVQIAVRGEGATGARPDEDDRKQVAADALYRAGMAYLKQAKTAEYDQSVAGQAIATFTDFMTLYPQDPRVAEAQQHIASLRTEQARTVAGQSALLEQFLLRERARGLALPFAAHGRRALLHGHCHQKAFAAFRPVERVLKLVPELAVETIESSCCGMAGAFGYQAETFDVSMKMAELSLLPAVRAAAQDAIIVADGTSCRHQIADGTGRQARHAAAVLAAAAG